MTGDGIAPVEWFYSRILEEGLASSIEDAMRQPDEIAMDILDLRSYARAKDMFDGTKKKEDLPDSPYIDLVWEFYKEQSDEVLAKRGQTAKS